MIICMGAGTITLPYIFYENGIYLGIVLTFFGGSLSLFTGYLVSYLAEKTGGRCYEEIAFCLYGKTGVHVSSFCNLLCNLGFLISYIVLVSSSACADPSLVQRLDSIHSFILRG